MASRKAPSMAEPYALIAAAAETKRNFNESAHAYVDAHERSAVAIALNRSKDTATNISSFRSYADAALSLAKTALASSDASAATDVVRRLVDHSRSLLHFLVSLGVDEGGGGLVRATLGLLGDARSTLGALKRATASAYWRRAEQIKTQLRLLSKNETEVVEENPNYAEAAKKANELYEEAHNMLRRCIDAEVVLLSKKPSTGQADSNSDAKDASERPVRLEPTNSTKGQCLDQRAKIYFELGDHRRAVHFWRAAVTEMPEDAYAFANLGVALREVMRESHNYTNART